MSTGGSSSGGSVTSQSGATSSAGSSVGGGITRTDAQITGAGGSTQAYGTNTNAYSNVGIGTSANANGKFAQAITQNILGSDSSATPGSSTADAGFNGFGVTYSQH